MYRTHDDEYDCSRHVVLDGQNLPPVLEAERGPGHSHERVHDRQAGVEPDLGILCSCQVTFVDVLKVDDSRVAAVRGGWCAVCCGRAVGPARAGRDADWDGTDAVIPGLLDLVPEWPIIDWQGRCSVGAARVIAWCQCARVEANGCRKDRSAV